MATVDVKGLNVDRLHLPKLFTQTKSALVSYLNQRSRAKFIAQLATQWETVVV